MQGDPRSRSLSDDLPDACSTQPSDQSPGQPDSLQQLAAQLGELHEYSSYYIRARMDRVKLTLRRAVAYSMLLVLATFAVFATVVISVWLLLIGLAEGLGSALGGRLWLGNIVVAILVLGMIALASWQLAVRRQRLAYAKTVEQ